MDDDNFEHISPNYHVPVQKSINELKQLDAEDESLQRYKAALLGSSTDAIPFPNDERKFIPESFSIVVDGGAEASLTLKGDLSKLKEQPISVPEGSTYRIKVYFYVQRDIVTGMRYEHSAHRAKVRIDQSTLMLGSYGPQKDVRVWTSDIFEAPKGVLHRGTYKIKSRFTDIDGNVYLEWKWCIAIVKSASSTD